MSRVVLFELSSQSPEQQAQFFSTVFGWEVSAPQWGYSSAATGTTENPGINGGIAQGPASFPIGTRIQIQVDSIDDAVSKSVEHGASIIQEKMDLDGFYLAYIVDPVGVQLGLIQYK